jgi:hypothetical protein
MTRGYIAIRWYQQSEHGTSPTVSDKYRLDPEATNASANPQVIGWFSPPLKVDTTLARLPAEVMLASRHSPAANTTTAKKPSVVMTVEYTPVTP